MAGLHISLLGGFEARLGSGEALPLKARKTQALVAYLALSPGQPRSREELVGLLWGDRGEEQARSSLRQSLSELRKALSDADGSLLIADRDAVSLNNDALDVDVSEFERLIDEGTPVGLEKASELYRGDLLDGIGVHDPTFEDWLRDERQRLRERACEALSKLLDHEVVGDLERAIATARQLLALDPLRETTHRALMKLYANKGERSLALKQYQACRNVLAAELGISPDVETEKLAEEVRSGVPGPGEGAGPTSKPRTPQPESLPLPDKPSIAVLPFINMSGDAEQEYFADGITEDIITELSRFRSLFVIARNSSFHYKGQSPKVQVVGRELGVQYVVEGSVRKAGNKVRITAQLIDGVNGGHLWAERYDRDLTDIFVVQDEITQMVVSKLAGSVEDATLERAKQMSTESLVAHDYVLRGDRDHLEYTSDGVVRARRAYLKAIELDPNYARAYAGLAFTHFSDWGFLWGEDPDGDLDRATEYAQKAVALDDAENRAHYVLGVAQTFRRDYARGKASLERAVALNPNDADVLAEMPYSFQLLGDCDAGIAMGEKALRLNPHPPSWYLIFLAEAYFTARRYENAIATFESATGELPDTAAFLASCYAQFGRIDEARALMASYLASADPEPWWSNVPASTPPVDNDRTGLKRYMVYMYPYKNSDDLDHLLDGMGKAGLEG